MASIRNDTPPPRVARAAPAFTARAGRFPVATKLGVCNVTAVNGFTRIIVGGGIANIRETLGQPDWPAQYNNAIILCPDHGGDGSSSGAFPYFFGADPQDLTPLDVAGPIINAATGLSLPTTASLAADFGVTDKGEAWSMWHNHLDGKLYLAGHAQFYQSAWSSQTQALFELDDNWSATLVGPMAYDPEPQAAAHQGGYSQPIWWRGQWIMRALRWQSPYVKRKLWRSWDGRHWKADRLPLLQAYGARWDEEDKEFASSTLAPFDGQLWSWGAYRDRTATGGEQLNGEFACVSISDDGRCQAGPPLGLVEKGASGATDDEATAVGSPYLLPISDDLIYAFHQGAESDNVRRVHVSRITPSRPGDRARPLVSGTGAFDTVASYFDREGRFHPPGATSPITKVYDFTHPTAPADCEVYNLRDDAATALDVPIGDLSVQYNRGGALLKTSGTDDEQLLLIGPEFNWDSLDALAVRFKGVRFGNYGAGPANVNATFGLFAKGTAGIPVFGAQLLDTASDDNRARLLMRNGVSTLASGDTTNYGPWPSSGGIRAASIHEWTIVLWRSRSMFGSERIILSWFEGDQDVKHLALGGSITAYSDLRCGFRLTAIGTENPIVGIMAAEVSHTPRDVISGSVTDPFTVAS